MHYNITSLKIELLIKRTVSAPSSVKIEPTASMDPIISIYAHIVDN